MYKINKPCAGCGKMMLGVAPHRVYCLECSHQRSLDDQRRRQGITQYKTVDAPAPPEGDIINHIALGDTVRINRAATRCRADAREDWGRKAPDVDTVVYISPYGWACVLVGTLYRECFYLVDLEVCDE